MRIWIYGAPFSGKTTFASNFKGAKILSTDGNAEYLFPKEDIIPIKSANDMKIALQKLRANPPKALIIDTTEYLIDYLRFQWLIDNKVDHESDIAYKGYGMLRSYIWEQIVTLANLCEDTIFISHESVIIEKNKFGREISKFEPDFDDKVKEKMAGLMTIIMRAVKTTNENNKNGYILHIGHLDEEMGGTRLPIKSTEIANDFNVFQNNFIKLEKEKEKENK